MPPPDVERWRYPASQAGTANMCVDRAILTGDAYYAVSDQTLYAIDLATGRDLWPPVQVRAPIEGRERAVGLTGLVDAGAVLVGVTPVSLMAFDKATGRLAWQVPGQYRQNSPSTAVADGVLYVQGHPGASPASEVQGRIVYQGGKPVEPTPALPGGAAERHRSCDTRRALVVLAPDSGSQLAVRLRDPRRWRTVGGLSYRRSSSSSETHQRLHRRSRR